MGSSRFTYDVVVVGYGSAGASAAIAAADARAKVLIVEKTSHLGGNTALSAGMCRVATDARRAAEYLHRTNGGRTDARLDMAMAEAMVETPRILAELARTIGATVTVTFGSAQSEVQVGDLYDWSGKEVLGWAGIESVPDFGGYPWLPVPTRGQHLMRTLELNVGARGIEVWFDCPARRLLLDGGRVIGVEVEREGKAIAVWVTGGVVLTCGGFEFDSQLLQDYLELPVIYGAGHYGNTGDGIRMAQQAGAALWHMWHIHGSYGFKFPEYPVSFRVKMGGVRRVDRKLAWILVDQNGRRFTNELHPAPQDTMWRPLQHLDAETGRFDRIPCWLLFDESGRQLGPIAKPITSDRAQYYQWSEDNLAEVRRGWIVHAPTLPELAVKTGLPADALLETVARWNAAVAAGHDDDFGRPPATMMPVAEPPFYAVPAWPVVSNTQGGPRHDEYQRVLGSDGHPIPGLYAAGELGSYFGHIYLLGGNLTECLAGGRIAGREAARYAGLWSPPGPVTFNERGSAWESHQPLVRHNRAR